MGEGGGTQEKGATGMNFLAPLTIHVYQLHDKLPHTLIRLRSSAEIHFVLARHDLQTTIQTSVRNKLTKIFASWQVKRTDSRFLLI